MNKVFKQDAAPRGEFAIKMVFMQILPAVTIASHLLAVWLSTKGSLFPGEDALMTIITTCSRIDVLSSSDTTLDHVVGSIKTRFKHLIWYITFNVLMALLFSIILMYCPVPPAEEMGFLYRLICNEFVLFAAFSIVLILYYSILIVEPNSIEKEAAKLKRKISGRFSVPGNAAEFISLYDKIEQRCNAMLPEGVLLQLHENKGRHFELILELLEEQNPLLKPLLHDLTRIHRYYECVVNCTPLSVSQDMCVLAKKVLTFLEQIASKLPVRR